MGKDGYRDVIGEGEKNEIHLRTKDTDCPETPLTVKTYTERISVQSVVT